MTPTRLGLALLGVWSLSGCIDGARVESNLPNDYLGPPPVTDADGGGSDADASGEDGGEVDAPIGDEGGDACAPGSPGCELCTVDADCAQFDDGDLCNGRWTCEAGTCVEDPEPVDCGGGEGGCQTSACNPSTGACAGTIEPNGTACNDGDPCTPGDRCLQGECVASGRIYCDDGNPCTDDSCADDGSCLFENNQRSCDDGNPCTPNDSCSLGACAGGPSRCECDDDLDCEPFDDGNACNGLVGCSPQGLCETTGAVQCEGDACTTSICDPSVGSCVDTPRDGAGCDDGDPCTVADTCDGGSCEGLPLDCGDEPCRTGSCNAESGICEYTPSDEEGCGCETDEDCAALDDGDACNGILACVGGVCQPDQIPICGGAGNPCVENSCDPATGSCSSVQLEGACDDGDPCTEGDTCADGACAGSAVSCEDEGECTAAACHPFAGCTVRAVGNSCTDGNACTEEACAGGECANYSTVICEDSALCLSASCDTATGDCVDTPVAGACDDGDPCTEDDTCIAGQCGGTPVFCDDGNPCTDDTCDQGAGCSFITNDNVCDDGNACTVGDLCADGACVGDGGCECTTAADCFNKDDGDACTGTLICDDGQCVVDPDTVVFCDPSNNTACMANTCQGDGSCAMVPRANGASCDDGSLCTIDDVCVEGACAGAEVDCDDGQVCTADSCDPVLGCQYAPADGSCDDGNDCTLGTECSEGACVGGTNTCDPCETNADCEAYDDGNQCNGVIRCNPATSLCELDLATVVSCPPSQSTCVDLVCDPAGGVCQPTPVSDGTPCEDGNACTGAGACLSGQCLADSDVFCDDGETCTADSCNPATGTCVSVPIAAVCDDGNPCSSGDICQNGQCQGLANSCPCTLTADCQTLPLNFCLGSYVCQEGGCVLQPGTAVTCTPGASETPCSFVGCDPETGTCGQLELPGGVECDDGDPCTTADVCTDDGQCVSEPTSCDDGDPCTMDVCNPQQGCVNTPLGDGQACDDDDACTTGTTCASGVCSGGTKTCNCATTADCPGGGDLCTGVYSCAGGSCIKSQPVICSGGAGPCRPSTCNPDSGECELVNAPNNSPCTDGNLCTFNDFCLNGKCTGNKVPCEDGDQCTEDTCSAGQCKSEPISDIYCDDGDFCTKLEQCQAGVCTGGVYVCDCDADDDCDVFDDGDKCNGSFVCVEGACQPKEAEPLDCLDSDPFDCIDATCDPETGECLGAARPDGQSCDDGSVCTVIDTCVQGECVGVSVVDCDDLDASDCIDHVCDPLLGECVVEVRSDGATCDDGDDCTTSDICAAGGCRGDAVVCEDDGDPCTTFACSSTQAGKCVKTKLFGPCDDGDPCTEGEYCQNGVCKGGAETCQCFTNADCEALTPADDQCAIRFECLGFNCVPDPDSLPDCQPDPEQPCMVAACDPDTGACGLVPGPDLVACDDGDPCTTGDSCAAGQCVGGPRDCDDGDSCTLDECEPDTGECLNFTLPTGFECDDGDPCNGVDLCVGGACKSGIEALCDCSTDADCAAFDDSDLCNGSLMCGPEGQCVVDPLTTVPCPLDPQGCSVSSCNPATGLCETVAQPTGKPCSDGEPCTAGDVCQGGECVGVEVSCDDEDPCTEDICDPHLGCVHVAFAGPCDDADPCTENDVCQGGECDGTPVDCDDGNPCTSDNCILQTGCVFEPKAVIGACDDGNACTAPDLCNNQGECVSGNNTCDTCFKDADCPNPDPCSEILVCVEGACVPSPTGPTQCPEPTDCTTVSCTVDGQCIVQPTNVGGACDDGNPCTAEDVCGATGGCAGTAVADEDAVSCSDDNVCTENDVCTGGVCGGDPIECATEVACKTAVCLPDLGCQFVDSDASCDDGNACTFGDMCIGGDCLGFEPVPTLESFDSGQAPGWTFESDATSAGWNVSGIATTDGPYALWAGNPSTGDTSDAGGPWVASALSPSLTIPEGASYAEMRFDMWLGVDGDGCDQGSLSVRVGGSQLLLECADSDGFVPVDVNLLGYAGSTIQVELRFSSGSSVQGVGLIIDDLRFDWQCPVGGN